MTVNKQYVRLSKSHSELTFVNVRSLFCWFLSFSISRRNFASFTGKPPSSETTEPGSKPTSSIKTRPNRSKDSRQRPNRSSWDISCPMIDKGLQKYELITNRRNKSQDDGAGVEISAPEPEFQVEKTVLAQVRLSKNGLFVAAPRFVWGRSRASINIYSNDALSFPPRSFSHLFWDRLEDHLRSL